MPQGQHLPDAPPKGLTVYGLTVDPQLGEIDTPNGKVVFLQAVAVTADETAAMPESGAVLGALAHASPERITDPDRS